MKLVEPIENFNQCLKLYETSPSKAVIKLGVTIDEWLPDRLDYVDCTLQLLIDEKAPPRLIVVALMVTKCIKNEIPNRKRLLEYYSSIVDNEEMIKGFR